MKPGRSMLKGGMEEQKDGRTDGHLEIPRCVLQDIGPLEPLPKKGRTLHFNPIRKAKKDESNRLFSSHLRDSLLFLPRLFWMWPRISI